MEIDPHARSGQKIFTGFDESMHVIEEEPKLDEHPEMWTTWLCCDPHPRRAHAFLWMCVSKFGDFVIPYSWWPEEENIERRRNDESPLLIREYSERLKKVHESQVMFPAPYQMLMDQAGKNFNTDEERNFFDGYRDEGIYFQPAKKNRGYAGYDKINKVLTPVKVSMGTGTEVIKPRLKIVRHGNGTLIQQLRDLRWKKLKGVALLEKDEPGEPIEKDHHLVDCLSYILMDDPKYIDRTNGLHPYTPIYPALGY